MHFRYFPALLALALCFAFAACDSGGDDGGDELTFEDLQGNYELSEAPENYLRITDSEFIQVIDRSSCYSGERSPIVESSGDEITFELTEEEADPDQTPGLFTYEFENEGEGINATLVDAPNGVDTGNTIALESTELDLFTLLETQNCDD